MIVREVTVSFYLFSGGTFENPIEITNENIHFQIKNYLQKYVISTIMSTYKIIRVK